MKRGENHEKTERYYNYFGYSNRNALCWHTVHVRSA